MDFDVFISHASEDKAGVARPLREILTARGLRVWLDETELRLGDSLRRSIDLGLARSRFGVVVLSHSFFAKEWPRKELDALVALEDGSQKVILPIWHGVTRSDIAAYSPLLADKLAASTKDGLDYVVEEVIKAIRPAVGSDRDANRRTNKTSLNDVNAMLVSFMDHIMELADAPDPGVTGVPSGLRDLDVLTTGLQASSLVVVSGRPSSGRTFLCCSFVNHVATTEGLPVMMFTPNESASDITRRLICSAGRINTSHVRTGRLTDDEWPLLVEAIERLRQANLVVDDASHLTVSEIEERAQRQCDAMGGLGMVVVDSIAPLVEDHRDDGQFERAIYRLKRLARHLRCPVVVVVDCEGSSRADQRPMLSDLVGQEAVERHADLVLLVHQRTRRDGSSLVNPVEVVVARQRTGLPIGTVLLGFRADSGTFEVLPTGRA